MVALRSSYGPVQHAADEPLPRPDPADWLTLQQAACELNVSVSTARRMIRKGRLRNRIVPRRGGFAYLVYLPDSRHKQAFANGHACSPPPLSLANGNGRAPIDLQGYASRKRDERSVEQIQRLEAQVERLSLALSSALKTKQKSLPRGMGEPTVNPADPYARYRWLARRKRWWPF
jgi:hypothetical protein